MRLLTDSKGPKFENLYSGGGNVKCKFIIVIFLDCSWRVHPDLRNCIRLCDWHKTLEDGTKKTNGTGKNGGLKGVLVALNKVISV